MNRKEQIEKLSSTSAENWDMIIIGGGATGLGIALDASSRGYKTLLLEQSDFAKGTSSKSTKLVHGGVRYLAKGDIGLVMEALKERGLLLKNAPHIAGNQEFIVPVYTWWDALKYTVGLTLYDLLAGKLSLGKSKFIYKKTVVNRLPLIRTEGLKGGIVYHDGQFDDARLAIDLAKSAIDHGATVLNYFKVTGLKKDQQGTINGVEAIDIDSDIKYSLLSGIVINATGVFADEIHHLDEPSSKPTFRPSQGVHIVLDNTFLNGSSALMIPETDDGRVLFAIPWHNKVVVGTTDTPVESVVLEPVAISSEIDFILQTAGRYLTKQPVKNDILSVFAGLRPLAVNNSNPTSTKEISRRHKITISDSGLISIVGGKWTTYRRMAQDVLNIAIKSKKIPEKPCITENLSIYRPTQKPLKDNRLMLYGEYACEIESITETHPSMKELIHPKFLYTNAEIVFIARHEMPHDIEDVLARRTRALFLDADASFEAAKTVASIMATELGLGVEWQKKQLESYHELLKYYSIH